MRQIIAYEGVPFSKGVINHLPVGGQVAGQLVFYHQVGIDRMKVIGIGENRPAQRAQALMQRVSISPAHRRHSLAFRDQLIPFF